MIMGYRTDGDYKHKELCRHAAFISECRGKGISPYVRWQGIKAGTVKGGLVSSSAFFKDRKVVDGKVVSTLREE